jgi:dTMP kinase
MSLPYTFTTPAPNQGIWISFEGIDGCGKSTQINLLTQKLTKNGYEVLALREPGGTDLGEKIRDVILKNPSEMSKMSESFLFLAARAELVTKKILPWLTSKKRVVICDRYLDSTLVYQGVVGKLGISQVLALHQFHPLNILPHRTVFLDLDPQVAVNRQKNRGQTPDYFERKGLAFQTELKLGYEQVAKLFPDRIKSISAEPSSDEIALQVDLCLENLW